MLALAVCGSAWTRQEAVQVTLDYVAKKADERAPRLTAHHTQKVRVEARAQFLSA
jgi:hypothetical protein